MKLSYKKMILSLLVLAVVCPLLTSCWDRQELEERAVILGISIDTVSDEAEKEESEAAHLFGKFPAPNKNMLRITAQIAIPGKIPLGPGDAAGEGGGGGSGASEQQSTWVLEVVGHTLNDALMNLQQQISGRIFLGHLRVIVISEEIARRGIWNLNDYLRRNSEVRRMAWLLVAKGNAKNFMMASPRLDRLPTLYLIGTLDEAVRMGKFPEDYIGMFWERSSSKGQEGYLPYVELKEAGNAEIIGIAYFRDDKMVGATKPLEIAAFMATKGNNPGGYRAMVSLDDNKQNSVTLYTTSRKSSFNVDLKNGLPRFTVQVFMELNVEERIGYGLVIDNSKILEKLQKEFIESSTKLQEDLIKQTQKHKSDIFGFGEYLRAKEPGYWDRNIGTAEKWQEMYSKVDIEVKVDAEIRRIGMKAR
ncbi:Ger(x)C family spore germination protein [Paenibacillus senegalensis]|uniref:Ger(x)C family spore germination protein n=1 Tax=Paenibacillus senegalensis TaxID=1465766 RepID=UPI000289D4EF|nr:Ger(x)C family spore germination protein [Paenibacillus senegalensis]